MTDIHDLIQQLHKQDCTISDKTLSSILQKGAEIIPDLAEIVEQTIEKSENIAVTRAQQEGTEWFTVIHAMYLLAHLRAGETLALVLEFLAMDEAVLEYWLHDLLDDDLWEVPYLLGTDQIEELEEFLLNDANNPFSRLAVCTALIQIALNHPSAYEAVVRVFKRLLVLPQEDTDFVGLVVNELLDLNAPALQIFMLDCLERNAVWAGIITAEQVTAAYSRKETRRRVPLDLFQRYAYFRQHPYFSPTAATQKRTMTGISRQVD